MRDEPQTVRELPAHTVTFIKVRPIEHYDWRPVDGRYQSVQTAPDEYPEPGSTWSYGQWDNCSPEEATHVLLNYTGYSDYSGSSCERSNNRSLLRDYPDTFTEARGGYGTTELMLSVNWTAPDDGRAGLLSDLAALADYPLYDEEDHSALETEEAWEAWDAYLSSDVRSDLERNSPSEEAMSDAIDAIEELATQHGAEYPATICLCGHVSRNWDDMILHLEQFRSLRDMFYDTLRYQDSGPYMETATDVVFPHYDDSIEQMSERIWQLRCEECTTPAPGQDALPMDVTS